MASFNWCERQGAVSRFSSRWPVVVRTSPPRLLSRFDFTFRHCLRYCKGFYNSSFYTPRSNFDCTISNLTEPAQCQDSVSCISSLSSLFQSGIWKQTDKMRHHDFQFSLTRIWRGAEQKRDEYKKDAKKSLKDSKLRGVISKQRQPKNRKPGSLPKVYADLFSA